MVLRWRHQGNECDGYGTRMHSVDFGCNPRCEEFSAIRRLGLLAWYGVQKNGLRELHESTRGWYDRRTRWVRDLPCGDTRVYLEFEVRRILCRNCRKVKREQLAF